MQLPRQLYLLRHAKSSWKDAALPDDERPLAPRGRRALALLAQQLRATDVAVDLGLCSPARRTRQTWAGVRAGLRSVPEVRFVNEIYEATADDLLGVLHQLDRGHQAVLLIGHNPGIEELAVGLVSGGEAEALTRLGQGFPTAALATLSFDVGWPELGWDSARLDNFIRPRDLADT